MVKKGFFSDRAFWAATLRLALPVALQNLLMSSGSMVDSIMVGQLGETALASVGMAGQWMFFFNLMLFGFSSGGAVFVAQYWGVKDMGGIRRTYGMLFIFTLLISLVYALPALFAPRAILALFTDDALVIAEGSMYLSILACGFIFSSMGMTFTTVLRSTESVKLPMVVSMISVGINVALNYVLIFGKLGLPELGLRGAAIATLVSMVASPVILLAISVVQRNIIAAPPRSIFAFGRADAWKFVRISMPVVLNEVLWALGTMGYHMMFGRLGTGNYSSLSIANTIQGISFVFYAGVCHACAVIVGKSVGAHEMEKAKLDSKRYVALVFSLTVLTGIMIVLLRAPITSLFNVAPEVKATASDVIMVNALCAFVKLVPYITIVGIFRAGGDTKTGTVIDIACLLVIGLPVTFLAAFVFNLSFPLVYAVMVLSENAPKTVLCLWHFAKYKWIQPLTEASASVAASSAAGDS